MRGKVLVCSCMIQVVMLLFLNCAIGGQRLELTSSDNHPLIGEMSLPGKKDIGAAVILLPMYRHTRQSYQPLLSHLTRNGFTVLAMDLRGHGESRLAADGSDDEQRVIDRDPSIFNEMYRDVEAASQYLARTTGIPQQRQLIIGASVGCSVAVHSVSKDVIRPAGVVLLTPGENYLGVPTLEHVTTWPGTPLLILSSREEQQRGADAIYEALGDNGAELHLFDKTNIHGTRMFGQVGGVEQLIVDWLAAKIPPPPQKDRQ
ncbi:MAG: alpha/beta fold hydrolase [Thermodesulfobacteriota bacterium]